MLNVSVAMVTIKNTFFESACLYEQGSTQYALII